MCKCRGTTDGKNVMVKLKGSKHCHHITATSVETSLILSVEKPLNGVKASTVLCFITFTLLVSLFNPDPWRHKEVLKRNVTANAFTLPLH